MKKTILAVMAALTFSGAAAANSVYVQHDLNGDNVSEVGSVISTDNGGYVFVGADTGSWAAAGYGQEVLGLDLYAEFGKFDVAGETQNEIFSIVSYSHNVTDALSVTGGGKYSAIVSGDVDDTAKGFAGVAFDTGAGVTLSYEYTYSYSMGDYATDNEQEVVASFDAGRFTPYVKYTHNQGVTESFGGIQDRDSDNQVTLGLALAF